MDASFGTTSSCTASCPAVSGRAWPYLNVTEWAVHAVSARRILQQQRRIVRSCCGTNGVLVLGTPHRRIEYPIGYGPSIFPDGIDFGGKSLSGCFFDNCDLRQALFDTSTKFAGASFMAVNFPARLDLHGQSLSGCNFDGCDLRAALFDDTPQFGDARFNGAKLPRMVAMQFRAKLFAPVPPWLVISLTVSLFVGIILTVVGVQASVACALALACAHALWFKGPIAC